MVLVTVGTEFAGIRRWIDTAQMLRREPRLDHAVAVIEIKYFNQFSSTSVAYVKSKQRFVGIRGKYSAGHRVFGPER